MKIKKSPSFCQVAQIDVDLSGSKISLSLDEKYLTLINREGKIEVKSTELLNTVHSFTYYQMQDKQLFFIKKNIAMHYLSTNHLIFYETSNMKNWIKLFEVKD